MTNLTARYNLISKHNFKTRTGGHFVSRWNHPCGALDAPDAPGGCHKLFEFVVTVWAVVLGTGERYLFNKHHHHHHHCRGGCLHCHIWARWGVR